MLRFLLQVYLFLPFQILSAHTVELRMLNFSLVLNANCFFFVVFLATAALLMKKTIFV